MNEQSVQKAFRVSPLLKDPLELDFRGKKLTVLFPSDLMPDNTYVITLSRELKDEHGVPLAEPVQIAYSSGENIDQGEISGTVFGDGNFSVHLWKLDVDNPADSIFAKRPHFIADAADDGIFRFQFLGLGNYQLLAMDSRTAGLPLNPGRMSYGLSWAKSINLGNKDKLTGTNMVMHTEPAPLRLLRGEWSGPDWGRLIFNQALPNEFEVRSLSLTSESAVPVLAVYYRDPLNPSQLIMLFPDSLPAGPSVVNLDQVSVGDSVWLEYGELSLRVPELYDTVSISWLNPKFEIKIIPERNQKPVLSFVLSDPVVIPEELKSTLAFLASDSLEVDYSATIKSPLHFELNLGKGWKENETYSLKIFGAGFKPAFGISRLDSVSEFKITTGEQMGYGSLIGKVSGGVSDSLLVDALNIEKEPEKFTTVVNSSAEFKFVDIPEGKYTLMIYEDKNRNGKYSFGSAFPHNPAEWFQVVSDTFEVRANWDKEILPIILKDGH